MNVKSPLFRNIPKVAFSLAVLLILAATPVSVLAQEKQQENRQENKIKGKNDSYIYKFVPSHLPIEVEVKNFDKEDWMKELEIKVTNMGDKPIYFLGFVLRFPDVKAKNNVPVVMYLRYGRGELIDPENKATSEDVPIKKGESCVIKISESQISGWNVNRAASVSSHQMRSIYLRFQMLNFGDGTGYYGIDGFQYPRPPGSSNCGPKGENPKRPKDLVEAWLKSPTNQSPNLTSFLRPATNLLVIFFLDKESNSQQNNNPQSLCCPGTPIFCTWAKPSFYTCFCVDNLLTYETSYDCNAPFYACREPVIGSFPCPDLGVDCATFELVPCGFSENCDRDNDQHAAISCGGDDCDDTNPNRHPGLTENCNDGIDNDCDEGKPNGGPDCEDSNCWRRPECPCSIDADGDGYLAYRCNGNDCNDSNFFVNPGMQENNEQTCSDGLDNDCDSLYVPNPDGSEPSPDLSYNVDCTDEGCQINYPPCFPTPTPTPTPGGDGGTYTTYYCSDWYLVTQTWRVNEDGSWTLLSETWEYLGQTCILIY